MSVTEQCRTAKEACGYCAALSSEEKNRMLAAVARALTERSADILRGNKADLQNSSDKPRHFLDRLMLDGRRLSGIAEGVKKLIELPDPVGEVMDEWTNAAGLRIVKTRVPLGVVGIIYEARPNVTADVIALCLKAGNPIVLRGSKDALQSNKAIVAAIKGALTAEGFRSDFIQLIEDATHEGAEELMKCRAFVDVLIPRGSAALIKTVVENSTVPVIETGAGNCHEYVEAAADLRKAVDILINGKVQRPSVCNSLETLLIDRSVAAEMLPVLVEALTAHGVEVRGCEETRRICPQAKPAAEADYYTEYDALIISVKVVSGLNEAVAHINRCGTHHSDVIITENRSAAKTFLNGVDSAAVYVNASTRFTDGFEFGYGAEMGISTQKLHARGPMGLRELTSQKFKIYGDGQIRK